MYALLSEHFQDDRLILAIVALFLCRALVGNAIVPPWQGPDEPSHFALVKLLTMPEGNTDAARTRVEAGVLESMARHGWWQFYQEETPHPVPRAFADVPEHLATGTLLQPLYYRLGSTVLRLLGPRDLESEYQSLRWTSVVLSALALVYGWAGTQLLFGTRVAIGSVTIAAFHPGFLLTALSVNPDVVVNFCGAVMWWGAARLYVKAHSRWFSLACIVAAAVAAAAAKRSGIPLLGVALVLLLIAFVRAVTQTRRPITFMAGILMASVAGGTVVWLVWTRVAGQVSQVLTFWSYLLVVRRPFEELNVAIGSRFLREAIDSSWLLAGWLRFPAPDLWLWTVRVLTVVGLTGAVGVLFTSASLRRSVATAWLFFVGLAVAALAAMFVGGAYPQGRYWFGALIPALVLIWLGVRWWLPDHVREPAAPVLLCGVAALDAMSFAFVLIPAYLR